MDETTKTYEDGEITELIWEDSSVGGVGCRVILRTFTKPRPTRLAPVRREGGYEVWYAEARPDWGPDDEEWVMVLEDLEDEKSAIDHAESYWPF